jgi:DNA-binding HxlR family transcriptional regulator
MTPPPEPAPNRSDPAPTDAACTADCPVQRASQVLDGKWTTLIVRDLLGGAQRFSQLQRSVGRVSPRLLTARLRLLEQEGVLTRSVHPTLPPTTEYALTDHGRRLYGVIQALAEFGLAAQARDRAVAAAADLAAAQAAQRPAVRRQVHRLR